jgi:hypothetical protein
MRLDRSPVPVRVGDGQDEPDRVADSFGERRAFQLGRSQLRLQVQQRPLDFHGDHLCTCIQHQINCPSIPARPDGNLKPHSPRWMGSRSKHFGDPKLAGISQANAIRWKQAKGEVMPSCGCEPIHNVQAGRGLTTLNLADEGLADPSATGHLSLCQTGHSASCDQFPGQASGNVACTRAEPDPRRGHGTHRGGSRSPSTYVCVTACLLGCAA